MAAYRRQAATKNEIDRQDEGREKTGVFTGSYAINPLNGEQIPVWIADYVLMGYGTGAIMAVPCGDQRDFEFARQVRAADPRHPAAAADVVRRAAASSPRSTRRSGPRPTSATPRTSTRPTTASTSTASTTRADGIAATNAWLEAHGAGESTITYKLRDWLFSRQRYWGEPFPIVYDVDGNPHALPDEMLPVVLPETDSFSPRTFDPDDEFSNPESPLDRLTGLGRGHARPRRRPAAVPPRHQRDAAMGRARAGTSCATSTPPTRTRFVDPAVEQYWIGPRTDKRTDHPGGVDLYVGGVEHAVLHLLYARFWHKVLFDLGHVSSKEPYAATVQPGLHPGCRLQGRARDLRRRDLGRATRRRLLRRRPTRHPRDGQDGQEPEERRLARRHVRRVRRRHAAAVRDGDGPDGRVPSVGDPRRGRHVPLPPAAVAQHRRRGHGRRARSSTPRPTRRPPSCCTARSTSYAPRWTRCGSTPRSPS